jgi:hypothetical protein
MSKQHLTTQQLDEALADFRQETLKTMATGENLEAIILGANTDSRILQVARCESPSELLHTVTYVFTSQAARVLRHIDDSHADKREELLTGLLKAIEEQIRSQLS